MAVNDEHDRGEVVSGMIQIKYKPRRRICPTKFASHSIQ
jgi:hypothetical protein